jgi:transposase-like protein
MPRLKGISFETAIIERCRRRESSVEEALIEMYLAGVSVRRVEDITEALWGSKVSPSTISELNKKAYVYEDGIEETLTYCDFPSNTGRGFGRTHVIERLNREIRRRTRVVGCFPDGNSALMLVCARLRHVAGTQWDNQKYMNMKHLETLLDDASPAG